MHSHAKLHIELLVHSSWVAHAPRSCADGDAAYQTGLVGPFEVASAAASRLPRLQAFMYEGPYGDCRAGLAALKVAELQVWLMSTHTLLMCCLTTVGPP